MGAIKSVTFYDVYLCKSRTYDSIEELQFYLSQINSYIKKYGYITLEQYSNYLGLDSSDLPDKVKKLMGFSKIDSDYDAFVILELNDKQKEKIKADYFIIAITYDNNYEFYPSF